MVHLRQTYPTVKISVEVEKPGRDGLQGLAAEADVIFYSKSWAQVSHRPNVYTFASNSVSGPRLPSSRGMLKSTNSYNAESVGLTFLFLPNLY
jgi:hypothetical protein